MRKKLRNSLHEMVFETQTKQGRIFDVILLIMIFGSIIVVMLDSIHSFHLQHGKLLHKFEWVFTVLFTIEYLMRVLLVKRKLKFVFSFLGIVDLLAILPTYFTLFLTGAQPLLMMRALRLLRIFRIFRLSHFLTDLRFLSGALISSMRKIGIFFMFALVLVIILASIMYLVEAPNPGFTSIPLSVYWAITTITTVGYGDIVPLTALGKVIANIIMFIGYAIIAVPTGIITTEMALAIKNRETGHEICKNCNRRGHDHDAIHCKYCGAKFEDEPSEEKSIDSESDYTIIPE